MKARYLAAGAVVIALAAFAVGRSGRAGPDRIEAAVATTAQAHAVEKEQRAPERITVRRILVPCPPSPVPAQATVEETVTERGPVTIERTTDTTATAQTTTVIRPAQPRLMVGATAAARITDPLSLTYGGEVKYRVAGPVWVGVAANARGEVTASVALTF